MVGMSDIFYIYLKVVLMAMTVVNRGRSNYALLGVDGPHSPYKNIGTVYHL